MSLSAILSISVSILCEILSYLILIRCILSYIPMSKGNIFTNAVYNLTEPLLSPVRRILGNFGRGHMMLDFSPVIVLLLIPYVIEPALIYFIQFIFR
ncbi:MAG: YggT family protein [Clostridia bacterium]|nr:YggT family protein [Clostridia bacterium]